MTSHPYLLEIEGLFTQGSRPGRTFGDSVGEVFEVGNTSDWSNGYRCRYLNFDTRSDAEFQCRTDLVRRALRVGVRTDVPEPVRAGPHARGARRGGARRALRVLRRSRLPRAGAQIGP